jgi:hypothetical protein
MLANGKWDLTGRLKDLESRACTCFEHYLLILRRCYTNGTWYIAWSGTPVLVQPTDITLTQLPSAVCAAPPEDEQVMLETCRGLEFLIN